MNSSIDAFGQRSYDEEDPLISAERLDGASFSTNPARLQSNQKSEATGLSDAQMQDSSDIDIGAKTTQGKREEVEDRLQKEGHEALSEIRKELEERTGFATYEAYLDSLRRDPCT